MYIRICYEKFQSTLPTRGSDVYTIRDGFSQEISIHAPHEGERQKKRQQKKQQQKFQSTLPTRGSDA